MALNIQLSLDSPVSSSSQSSNKKSSSTDSFAQDMKASAAKQSKQPAPKPAKPASTPKPKHSDDDSQTKHASSSTNKPKASSASQATTDAQSGQDASAPDDAAAATEANAIANGAKGRVPARPAVKNAPSQDVAAKNAEDDPSADSTNQPGLSLLQLLAKKLGSDDTDTTSTDAAAPAASDKSSTDGAAKTTSDDPNAVALSMFSQALAATLARQQITTSTSSAVTSDATTSITSATQSPGGAASMQDLMSVIAKDVAANAKGNSDDSAAQFNVDPTKAAASDDSGSTDTSAIGPNALAHLGVASHFAAQHLRNDTNAADLKSPVGSSAWQDEVGTHLTWMTEKGLETGSLRVNPEHLGPVEVNISVQNGDATVWFAANHPDTRAALEQALPRLREMFANQGMNLADSGVSRQSLSQQGSRNQSRSGASQGVTGVSAVGAADGSSGAAARVNLGLVDLYA